MADKGVNVTDELERICREILSPLVRADGGVFYLVNATNEDVHIHLGGACAGCPGATMTRERVFEPAIVSALPKAKVRVTTGFRVPEGARRFD